MTATVEHIIRIMEELAPPGLAEKWDNAGLQVGKGDWPAGTVWIALDPLPEVVEQACREKVNLLITHHPLFLHPFRTIDFATPSGQIIRQAAQNRLAIYAAHTNFDSVSGGLNDMLARRIGLKKLHPLVGGAAEAAYKLVVFAPVEHEQKLLEILIDSRAGFSGVSQTRTFSVAGKGIYLTDPVPGENRGENGGLNKVAQVRVESVVTAPELTTLLGRLRSCVPAESMAYDLYPLVPPDSPLGIGRWGELPAETDLKSLALHVKNKLGLPSIRMVGRPETTVEKVAVCTGSGGSLMPNFLASPADAFITGDLRYHEARDAQAAERGVIDIGHFASEHIMVPELTRTLREIVSARGLEANILACTFERDPFIRM